MKQQRKTKNIRKEALQEQTAKKALSNLEKLFEVQRIENAAAALIQSRWRGVRYRLSWKRAVYYNQLVCRIQKYARGMVVRKWVAEWYMTRIKIVTNWQAHTRRYLSNLHLRSLWIVEKQMAIKIQKMFRGFSGRKIYIMKLKNAMAIRIQTIWRGVVGRSRADIYWLNRACIPLQKAARRFLAFKCYNSIKNEKHAAALVIQKRYRSWKSRCRLGNALVEREMNSRMSYIRMLTSEEEICQEKLMKMVARLNKNNLKFKAENSMRKLLSLREKIRRKENDLIELRRQLDLCTPRSKEQGWATELAKNSVDIRDQITVMKMQYLFEVSEDVNNHEGNLENQVQEIERISIIREAVADWKDQEYEERRHFSYKDDINQHRKMRRRAVAEERRRWQVFYYSQDGKPDKCRRPGRPWHPSVYAGAEKAVYSVGKSGVDLFAHNTKGGDVYQKETDAQHILEKVSLQSYLEQVSCYEQLLKPIADIMQKSLTAPHSRSPPKMQSSSSQSIRDSLLEVHPPADESQLRHFLLAPKRTLASTMGPVGREFTSKLLDLGILHSNEEESDRPRYMQKRSIIQLPRIVKADVVEASKLQIKSVPSRILAHRNVLEPIDSVPNEYGANYDSEATRIKVKKLEQRRERKKYNQKSAVIPWDLLDTLDGEKKRFEKEKLYVEFHRKF